MPIRHLHHIAIQYCGGGSSIILLVSIRQELKVFIYLSNLIFSSYHHIQSILIEP